MKKIFIYFIKFVMFNVRIAKATHLQIIQVIVEKQLSFKFAMCSYMVLINICY